jgi:hypothetical protein
MDLKKFALPFNFRVSSFHPIVLSISRMMTLHLSPHYLYLVDIAILVGMYMGFLHMYLFLYEICIIPFIMAWRVCKMPPSKKSSSST